MFACFLFLCKHSSRFHTFNGTRPSETVPQGSQIPDSELFARPPDPRNPRGWLVDLINLFGKHGGFQILLERFQSGKNLSVPVICALLRPFGLCYEMLTIPTIEKYFMSIVVSIMIWFSKLSHVKLFQDLPFHDSHFQLFQVGYLPLIFQNFLSFLLKFSPMKMWIMLTR